jgi:NTE family protein
MMEVMLRRDEIVYSERIRNDVRTRDLVGDFHKLVEDILGEVAPDKLVQIKQRPRYIQLMGDIAPVTITRIVREMPEDALLSNDYDFSHKSLELHKRSGYSMAQEALNRSHG